MKDLSLMTWSEVRDIDKKKSIVFAVLAPIEEHGKHLPLATDIVEGEYWSKGAMTELERRLAAECFFLPPFPIASASVNEFYGSIHFTMKTTYDVTYAVLESLCYMGFMNIAVIASHADPQHQIAVEKAVRKINRKNGICAIAPMGQIFMGVSAYRDMPDTHITDRDMIVVKRQLAAMGEYGYLGAPGYASAELGKDLNDNCIASICDAVEKFYRRDGYQKYAHYRLYDILPLHIGFIELFGKVRRKKVI